MCDLDFNSIPISMQITQKWWHHLIYIRLPILNQKCIACDTDVFRRNCNHIAFECINKMSSCLQKFKNSITECNRCGRLTVQRSNWLNWPMTSHHSAIETFSISPTNQLNKKNKKEDHWKIGNAGFPMAAILFNARDKLHLCIEFCSFDIVWQVCSMFEM